MEASNRVMSLTGATCASAAALVSYGSQNFKFNLILGSTGSGLHSNQVLQIAYLDCHVVEVNLKGGDKEIFVTLGATWGGEHIEVASIGDKREGVTFP